MARHLRLPSGPRLSGRTCGSVRRSRRSPCVVCGSVAPRGPSRKAARSAGLAARQSESLAGTGSSRSGRERAPPVRPPPLSEVLSMTMIPASAAASPTAPHALGHIPNPTAAIFQAAQRLLSNLDHGQRIDAPILRAAMEAAFGASDATGAWDWKSAYEACEVATVLFLRKYGNALVRKAGSPAQALPLLAKVADLPPTPPPPSEHTQPPP